MITEDSLNKTLRDTVLLILGNPKNYLVLKADQNYPRPADPYCVVKILSSIMISEEETSSVDLGDGTIEVTTQGMRKVMATFNFFREDSSIYGDPHELASKVRAGLNRQSSLDFMRLGGIGLLNRGPVQNLTTKLDNGFEDRSGLTAYFSIVDTDIEIIDKITSVTATGIVEYGERQETILVQTN